MVNRWEQRRLWTGTAQHLDELMQSRFKLCDRPHIYFALENRRYELGPNLTMVYKIMLQHA